MNLHSDTLPLFPLINTLKVVGRDWGIDSNKLKQKVGSIRFAGEATAGMWSDTTFGAWRTGDESAKEMIEEIRSS